MQVKKLTLKNFKAIKDFEKEFSGNIYFVQGDNEIGKSTLMDAIMIALTGKRSDNLLTTGEKKGEITAVIGDKKDEYIISLNYSQSNPRGTFKITHGGFSTSSAGSLAALFEYTRVDAFDFARKSNTVGGRREQVETIKSMLPKEIVAQLGQIADEIRIVKESLTGTTALKNDYKRRLNEYSVNGAMIEKYRNEIDVLSLSDELHALDKYKTNYETALQRFENLKTSKLTIMDSTKKLKDNSAIRIAELEEKIKKEKSNLAASLNIQNELMDENNESIKVAEKWFLENKQPDIEKEIIIRKEIADSDEHNQKYKIVAEYLDLTKKLEVKETEISEGNDKVKKLEDEKAAVLSESKIGIKGLTFDEDGLYLNGIPFRSGEISTSQEMEIAFRVICALNKKAKIFCIGRGESLGSDKMNRIIEFAKKHKYQGFIEEVVRGQEDMTVEEYEVQE